MPGPSSPELQVAASADFFHPSLPFNDGMTVFIVALLVSVSCHGEYMPLSNLFLHVAHAQVLLIELLAFPW
jgi:hypothetical protein